MASCLFKKLKVFLYKGNTSDHNVFFLKSTGANRLLSSQDITESKASANDLHYISLCKPLMNSLYICGMLFVWHFKLKKVQVVLGSDMVCHQFTFVSGSIPPSFGGGCLNKMAFSIISKRLLISLAFF